MKLQADWKSCEKAVNFQYSEGKELATALKDLAD